MSLSDHVTDIGVINQIPGVLSNETMKNRICKGCAPGLWLEFMLQRRIGQGSTQTLWQLKLTSAQLAVTLGKAAEGLPQPKTLCAERLGLLQPSGAF